MNIDDLYPDGIDAVWIASDQDGHVGAFMTAGIGPIPYKTLVSERLPFDDLYEEISKFSVIINHHLNPEFPDDPYAVLAERGFFVYDYCDIHRVRVEYIHEYDLDQAPSYLVTISDLPNHIIKYAEEISIPLSFTNTMKIDVRNYLNCVESIHLR